MTWHVMSSSDIKQDVAKNMLIKVDPQWPVRLGCGQVGQAVSMAVAFMRV